MKRTQRIIFGLALLGGLILIYAIFGPPPAETMSTEYAHTGRYDQQEVSE